MDAFNNPREWLITSSRDDIDTLLQKLCDSYYKGNPLITDDEYDSFIDLIEEIVPIQNKVGYEGEKTKLPFSMYSLNKIKVNVSNVFNTTNIIVSDKLDGVSAMIYTAPTPNDDGTYDVTMYTRGNSTYGRNISHLNNYPTPPAGVAVRGELILTKTSFNKFNDGSLKNARNTVAGIVNCKEQRNQELCDEMRFVAYNIVNKPYSIQKQLEKLKKWKFNTVTYSIIDGTIDDDMLISYFNTRRNTSKYEIDGLVVTKNDKAYPTEESNPSYAFAFKTKLDDQIAQTKVSFVEWNISKDNYLKPIVHFEPVVIGGVTISKSTGFCARFIKDNGIGEGAIIEIIRSGDVIPKIERILKSVEPEMPDRNYTWTKTNVDIVCNDISDEQIVKQITHFFKTIDVKYFSQKTVEKLVDAGNRTIKSIIDLNISDYMMIDTFKEKLSTKLHDELHTSLKEVELSNLMAASQVFGRNFGKSKAELVIEEYPDINDWNAENLSKIKGLSYDSAKLIISNLENFVSFCESISFNIEVCSPQDAKESSKFKGIVFMFSGIRDKELEKYIISRSGVVSSQSSVSTKISILIHGNTTATSKYKQAKSLGVQTINIDEFKSRWFIKNDL